MEGRVGSGARGSLTLASTTCLPACPQLHYLRLPKDIRDDHVILMDCTVSTGAAAMMAVRVLLVRKGVRGGWVGG